MLVPAREAGGAAQVVALNFLQPVTVIVDFPFSLVTCRTVSGGTGGKQGCARYLPSRRKEEIKGSPAKFFFGRDAGE